MKFFGVGFHSYTQYSRCFDEIIRTVSLGFVFFRLKYYYELVPMNRNINLIVRVELATDDHLSVDLKANIQ